MMNKERTILEVEIKEGTGLRIKHRGERPKGAKGVISNNDETVFADPSEAFTKAVRGLKEALVKSTALGAFENAFEGSLLADHLQGADLPQIIRKTLRFVAGGLAVKALVIKHDAGTIVGAKIKGEFVNKQGDPMTISSPLIRFDGAPAYGWESTLLKKVEAVVLEAQTFLNGNYTRMEEPEAEEVPEEVSEKKAAPKAKKKKKKLQLEDDEELPVEEASIGSRMRAVKREAA
jgi:hypothetical protein